MPYSSQFKKSLRVVFAQMEIRNITSLVSEHSVLLIKENLKNDSLPEMHRFLWNIWQKQDFSLYMSFINSN